MEQSIFEVVSEIYIFYIYPQRRKKPDTYNKDRMFVTSFAFCVITFEPIEVQTCSAPQNDRLSLSFVKDICVDKKVRENVHFVCTLCAPVHPCTSVLLKYGV